MGEYGIGKRIRQYRDAAGMSQERLAEVTGLSSNFISCVERGAKKPGLDSFIRIACAINVSADLLLADVLKSPNKERAEDLQNRIDQLPPKEQRRILAVVETMITEC